MITHTSLTNPAVACKLHGAMIRAILNTRHKQRQAVQVSNRDGLPVLLVWYVQTGFYNSAGNWVQGLVFQDYHTLKDITNTVRKALRKV